MIKDEMTLEELKEIIKNCKRCPLYKTRKNMVFGEGNPNADIMFIGEGPGKMEDETGHVFVGKSGKLLDQIFEDIGMTRNDIYIANIVKCRVPNNMDPSPKNKEACFPYLCHQVKIIKPKIIVCLGRIAATTIINFDFKITKQHGKWYKRNGYFITATFHPSAILRDPGLMESAMNDFKFIGKKFKELENSKI